MVERLQETPGGATFVDLDGTLITGNSMRVFMRCLPSLLLRRNAPGAAIASLWWMGLRAVRLVDHRRMKWHLTKCGRRHLEHADWEALAELISRCVNPKVSAFVAQRRRLGCLTYIASAAPEEYTLPLCRRLGYDGVVATVFSGRLGDYVEMRGRVKHDGIERILDGEKLRLDSFVTDHPDDIPTAAAYPQLTVVVNPSDETAEKFRTIGVTRFL